MWAELGIPRIYSTTATTIKPAPDDYKAAADNVREVGEIAAQFKLTAMFEFVRQSTFASTLPTILSITRAAAQPNLGPLFDFYHFWSGNNKLDDIDALRPGEIKHVHFQDVPDMPREMLDATTRFIPGEGVSPIDAMLRKLAEKGYDGALSVELFLPRFSDGDPFEVAREIKGKCRGGDAPREGSLIERPAGARSRPPDSSPARSRRLRHGSRLGQRRRRPADRRQTARSTSTASPGCGTSSPATGAPSWPRRRASRCSPLAFASGYAGSSNRPAIELAERLAGDRPTRRSTGSSSPPAAPKRTRRRSRSRARSGSCAASRTRRR